MALLTFSDQFAFFCTCLDFYLSLEVLMQMLLGSFFFSVAKEGSIPRLEALRQYYGLLGDCEDLYDYLYERDNAWRFPMDVRSGTSVLSLKDL